MDWNCTGYTPFQNAAKVVVGEIPIHCSMFETMAAFPLRFAGLPGMPGTIDDAISTAMIASFLPAPDFGAYYASCAPQSCVYTREATMTGPQLFALVLGVLGGMNMIARFVVAQGFSLGYRKVRARASHHSSVRYPLQPVCGSPFHCVQIYPNPEESGIELGWRSTAPEGHDHAGGDAAADTAASAVKVSTNPISART